MTILRLLFLSIFLLGFTDIKARGAEMLKDTNSSFDSGPYSVEFEGEDGIYKTTVFSKSGKSIIVKTERSKYGLSWEELSSVSYEKFDNKSGTLILNIKYEGKVVSEKIGRISETTWKKLVELYGDDLTLFEQISKMIL